MADPTLVAATSPPSAPVTATLAAMQNIGAGHSLARGGLGDLVEGRKGETRQVWHPMGGSSDLLPDRGQALSWSRLQILSPQPAPAAVMVAANLDTFPETHIPDISHPIVSKEGV